MGNFKRENNGIGKVISAERPKDLQHVAIGCMQCPVAMTELECSVARVAVDNAIKVAHLAMETSIVALDELRIVQTSLKRYSG